MATKPPAGKPSSVGRTAAATTGNTASTFPFWNNHIQGISKRAVPGNHAYIAWYGTLTGDIWHVAAAQILNEYANTAPTNRHRHPFPGH